MIIKVKEWNALDKTDKTIFILKAAVNNFQKNLHINKNLNSGN